MKRAILFLCLCSALAFGQQAEYLMKQMNPKNQFIDSSLKQINDNAPINMGIMSIVAAEHTNDSLVITYQLTAPNPQLVQTPKEAIKTQAIQMLKATKQHEPYLDYGLTLVNRYLDEAGKPLFSVAMTPTDFMTHMTPEEIEIQRLKQQIKQLKGLLTEEQKAALKGHWVATNKI